MSQAGQVTKLQMTVENVGSSSKLLRRVYQVRAAAAAAAAADTCTSYGDLGTVQFVQRLTALPTASFYRQFGHLRDDNYFLHAIMGMQRLIKAAAAVRVDAAA
jgi:hypothetical protein